MKNCRRFIYSLLAIATIGLSGSLTNVSAATFTVTNANDTGAGSLRQAVLDANAAATADTIVFDASFSVPRTINLASLIAISSAASVDNLTIVGPGANLLTINATGTNRVFTNGFTNGTNTDTLTISGMTITRSGNPGSDLTAVQNAAILNATDLVFSSIMGGAIDNTNNTSRSSLTVTNCVFNSNTGFFGGAAITNNGVATVTNSTFTSNTAGAGGAISNGDTLSVSGSTFTNNTAVSGSATGLGGGAIYSSSSATGTAAAITNSTFVGNAETGGSGGGGAIRNRSGSMTISTSTFTSNTALSGGGAIQGGGVTNISGSTFTGNSASGPNAQQSGQGSGGAISNQGGAQTTIADSVITGNGAVGHGGGIYYQPNGGGALMSVTNTTVSNNTANTNTDLAGSGGGFYIEGPGVVTVTRSTISGNLAKINRQTADLRFSGDGGGFFVQGALTLENSTVSGNTAEQDYGGIVDTNPGGSSDRLDISSSTIVGNRANGNCGGFGIDSSSDGADQSLRNTIIANNTSSGAAQDVRTAAAINSLGYNFIKNITGANIAGVTTGNIYGQDPVLGPLEDNGGLTFTHAPLVNSPVIDKGNSFTATTDQRAFARPFDYPGIASVAGGDGADIGAVEMRPTAQISGRVATPSGQGLRNATVYLTDSLGNRSVATTSTFGLYSFANIPTGTGLSYTITVSSKRYRFAPRVINVNGDRSNVDFLGLE